jgi:hypothetical protein
MRYNNNNNNNIFNLSTSFLKIKNGDLKISKRSKFLHPTRFSYKEFNEHDKLYIELGYGALQSTRVLCALRSII